MGDGLSLSLFADRIGLNVAALLTAGFALHAALGVVERGAFGRLRSLVLLAGAGVLVFAGLRLLILNAQMGDGTVLFDPDLFSLSWIALGPSTTALSVGAVAGVAGVFAGSRILAGIGAVVLATAFGLTGHSQGLADPGLAPVAVAAHGFIASFWVVAPITLYPVVRLGDDVLLARLKRFSAIAMAAIPLLLLLGVWLAFVLAGGVTPLLGSIYGWLLLAKLAVSLIAMAMGALNKQVVTTRIEVETAMGRRWLRLTLALEAALFATAILAVSAATTIAGPSE
ncbi:MAG: CopD family protein [Alphaproteobacteria bacterium]|nr:CopD family protein [Alphaproteobacteria bacterium]